MYEKNFHDILQTAEHKPALENLSILPGCRRTILSAEKQRNNMIYVVYVLIYLKNSATPVSMSLQCEILTSYSAAIPPMKAAR